MEDPDSEQGPLETDLEDDDEIESPDETFSRRERKNTPTLGNPFPSKTKRETGFHRSTRMCLEQIREAMLHHRWQEAAEFMACYPQVLEDTTHRKDVKELIWRLGTEILHHHPNSKMEDYNNIYERMKHSGFKHYLLISLEHAFHLLLHGHIDDAKRQLQAAESWRYGKVTVLQSQQVKLIQAYRCLLDYIIWCDKRFTHNMQQTDNNFEDPLVQLEMNNYYRQASLNLKEIVRKPGVWDPFILSYVDMLEFYQEHTEAEEVLSNYAYDKHFPPNPNAHVFLYEFLKRHGASDKKLMKELETLSDLVPSHELMLEYTSLLLESEKPSLTNKALGIILEMLDFACWRSNLGVWKYLDAIIKKLKSQDRKWWKKVLREHMAGRKEWWPTLHFTSFQAKKDSEESPELMKLKASLKIVICPDSSLKYSAAEANS